MSGEISTDVVIVGGGVGGTAAAIALGEAGVRCVVLEPSPWIGGQLTSQGVPPDENRWVESFGSTRRYRRFRSLVREQYRLHESLTDDALSAQHLNPGGGWVSRLCCSPRIAHRVLRAMIGEAGSGGCVDVFDGFELVGVETDGDRISAVRGVDSEGAERVVAGSLFLEASESGDLLELGAIEHRVGAESAERHDEAHGLAEADERCQQPPTWCFAVEHRPRVHSVIEKPDSYDTVRGWVPQMNDRAWTGPLLSWTIPTHGDAVSRELAMVPAPDEPGQGALELWRYRRIVDASLHTDGRPDVSLFNVVQMDDWRTPILSLERGQREAAMREAKELAASFLYWMQTEAPRHDGGVGYPGLTLAGRHLGTGDGFAMTPYIREPRRLEARRMLAEGDVGATQRRHLDAGSNGAPPEGRCEPFHDSVAIGHYHIDLHPTPTGRNSIYVESSPFQIPLRSLVPVRVSNVLSAGKCLGVTHIVNGATRTHAVEWSIGEAAGIAAAECIRTGTKPSELCESPGARTALRERLGREGAPTRWPWDPS
ncbi:MAG: FAD-dependent oxidoreductase [Planctomycetota bacterium]